jgi:hypothetical protein
MGASYFVNYNLFIVVLKLIKVYIFMEAGPLSIAKASQFGTFFVSDDGILAARPFNRAEVSIDAKIT